ncbi:helix-turn-helix transcriptional regulator [Oleiharenicola lentus]|uniref:helix-turn-helix transcriptional regulator n=1 Tax=Oleiharenicola lentus TaxID=2508720 RepID=UPI003F6794EF
MPNPATTELRRLVAKLPQPNYQLIGHATAPLPLPTHVVCFQRQTADELNKPRKGRAFHHRFVLICALETAATVCVDNHNLRLNAGDALLVFPFQFHHYIGAKRDAISWLFVTFELNDSEPLAALRYQPFALTRPLRAIATDLVEAYETETTEELPALLLALLLARIRRLKPKAPQLATTETESELVLSIDQIAQRPGAQPTIREMAKALGISSSHLRARFHASCGVSIGRHLRRLRLEKACGLLRLGPQRVSEIAEQCGFSSIHNFSRAFRQAYKISPLAYRHSGKAAPKLRRKRAAKSSAKK